MIIGGVFPYLKAFMCSDWLVEDPTLLLRLFIPALIRNDVEGVGLLLSIYKKQKQKEDDELLIWGNSIK